MTDVTLTPKPPETVLSDEPAEVAAAIATAGADLEALSLIAAKFPRSMQVWAAMAGAASSTMERYAYARVGYHRGLDRLRAEGWRGAGYVRYAHVSNRGFLDCLAALAAAAAEIDEGDEAQRCRDFLRQLDPDWK